MKKYTRYGMYNEWVKEKLASRGKDIDNIKFTDIENYDYTDNAIVNEDTKEILYFNDNIHAHPDEFEDGFLPGLRQVNAEFDPEIFEGLEP